VEIAHHDATAWFVAPGEPASLADGLATLLTDNERRMRLARAGRSQISRRFDICATATRLVEIYRSVLAERRSQPADHGTPER